MRERDTTLDAPPATEEERVRRRVLLRHQLEAAMKARGVMITCASCPLEINLPLAFRCLYCGFFFCAMCGKAHFATEAKP